MRAIYRNYNPVINVISTLLIFSSVIFPSLLQAEETLSLNNGQKSYRWYCTPCHGVKGDGKGFNAQNLDPRPTNHADTMLMEKRTDDDLFNVIQGGGKAAGKSTLMPPWGKTFSKVQIDSLILYLRTLCNCQKL